MQVSDARADDLPREAILEDAGFAALSRAVIAISGELSVDAVLQRIADTARELLGARYAALGVADTEGRIRQFLTSGLDPDARLAIGPLPQGHGLLGVLIREGRPLRVDDISAHPRTHGFPANHPTMRSLLGVPIVSRGEVVGDLYLADRLDGRPFSGDDEHLVLLLARHAAVAIQNARLHARVQELVIHEERGRIMRDLHDGIIQSIFAIGLGIQDTLPLLDSADPEVRVRLERSVADLDLVMSDLRRYILDLERARDEPPSSLESRLQRTVNEFQAATSTQIQLSVSPDLEDSPLPDETRDHLVQIAREALANVVKHSRADAAALRLERTGARLVLTVWDNGVGFNPAGGRSNRQRGLRNIRARAKALGGQVLLRSQIVQGTQLMVSVPLRRREGSPA